MAMLWISTLFWLVAGLASGTAAFSAGAEDLIVTVEADSLFVPVGEPLVFRASRCNPTAETIDVLEFCPCCHTYLEVVDDAGNVVADAALGCILAVTNLRFMPGQCHELDITWAQHTGTFDVSGYVGTDPTPVEPGLYTLRYTWDPPTASHVAESAPVAIFRGGAIPTASTLSLALFGLLLSLVGVGFFRFRTT